MSHGLTRFTLQTVGTRASRPFHTITPAITDPIPLLQNNQLPSLLPLLPTSIDHLPDQSLDVHPQRQRDAGHIARFGAVVARCFALTSRIRGSGKKVPLVDLDMPGQVVEGFSRLLQIGICDGARLSANGLLS